MRWKLRIQEKGSDALLLVAKGKTPAKSTAQNGAKNQEKNTSAPDALLHAEREKMHAKSMALIDADNHRKYHAVNVESQSTTVIFTGMQGVRHRVGNES